MRHVRAPRARRRRARGPPGACGPGCAEGGGRAVLAGSVPGCVLRGMSRLGGGGEAAGGLAKRPRGGLWRMGGGRNGGGWALETLGGGVGELPCSSGLGILGIFPLGWRTTTPEGWG